jgi:chorismate lyase/3-hydroxybenzoate synthase
MMPGRESQVESDTLVDDRDRRARALDRLPPLEPRPARWVDDLFGRPLRIEPSVLLQSFSSGALTLLTTSVLHARALTASRLRERVAEAYIRIAAELEPTGRTPVRFWNFIPDINDSMGDGTDRYMAFNAGRSDGFSAWSSVRGFDQRPLATASAVGVDGADLVIYCLASTTAPRPIENPRQKPSWQYSVKYGPVPPCFSRATIAEIGRHAHLLIGGTASIVGEDSVHQTNLDAQLEETLQNLAALVRAAAQLPDGGAPLERLTDLRGYVRREEHAEMIRRGLRTVCPNARRIDLVRADICRPELLLEIEAIAEL